MQHLINKPRYCLLYSYNTGCFWLTMQVQWIPKEDRGPKGAEGRASFDPIISVALIVTLYRVCTGTNACACLVML